MEQLSIFDFLAKVPEIKAADISAVLKPKAETSEKLQDFGKKIGGARKDLWRSRGLWLSDLAEMSDKEKAAFVTKDNVWPKINYRKLVEEGTDKTVAFAMKMIRDAVPLRPDEYGIRERGLEQAQKDYVSVAGWLKEKTESLTSLSGMFSIWNALFDAGYMERISKYSVAVSPCAKACITGKVTDALYSTQSKVEYKMKKNHFLERSSSGSGSTKKKYKLSPLDSIRSIGYDYRNGRHVKPEQMIDELGFRGGEFGNWLNQNECQLSLDYCYDSIRNLALALGITPKQLTKPSGIQEEPLAIAFGSRGRAYTAAHYETGFCVINLTKMHGAGSLAHEMGHFIDNCICINQKLEGWSAVQNQWCPLMEIRQLRTAMNYKQMTNAETIASRHQSALKEYHEIREFLITRCSRHLKTMASVEWEEACREYLCCCMENMNYRSCDYSEEYRKLCSADEGAGMLLRYNHRYVSSHRKNLVRFLNLEKEAEKDPKVFDFTETQFRLDAERLNAEWSKLGHGYWTSDCEMFARAFACYIKDKLAEKGITDDYLCGHCEADGCTKGEERKVINQKFDQLFAKLKNDKFF